MFTPSKTITYSNQDFDEKSALRRDVDANPSEYLKHPDGLVRSMADWYLRYAGRNRPHIRTQDWPAALRYIDRLYDRLKELA